MRIAKDRGWGAADVPLLASISAEDFVKIFKSQSGKDLKAIIETCMWFASIVNVDVELKEVTKRAKRALEIIGAENPLNALRLIKYGIKIAKK